MPVFNSHLSSGPIARRENVSASEPIAPQDRADVLPAWAEAVSSFQLTETLASMMPSEKHLLLAHSGPEPEVQDRRLCALAEWMGVSVKAIAIREGKPLLQRLVEEYQPGSLSLAMSAETLAALQQDADFDASLHHLLEGLHAELLVFGCTSAPEHQAALLALTGGAVAGIGPLDAKADRFSLPHAAIELSRQLAGLSFSGSYREPAGAFELRGNAADADVILTANERPVFVRLKQGSALVYLLAGPLPDVDMLLSPSHGIEEHYAALVPPLIFLRNCFQEGCWHSPQSTARLILDDPGLSKRYGFLDYDKLLRSMQRSGYGTTIAFIPWNGWRTTRKNAAHLLYEGSRLSICIHGCDHTNREFESQDAALLDIKSGLAMQRMEAQQRRTGAPFEPVMVFPQGRFSAAAIPALRANRYLAAVNTTVFPVDCGPDDIRVRDFLRPAMTRYNGFPIFLRHYPRHIFDFAFDLFVGKPALLVEHHPFFREGYEAVEAVVAQLHNIEPSLTWPSLSEQLTQSCLQRRRPNGSTEILFFTRRFQFENREGRSERFLLSKREPKEGAIRGVSVDGVNAPYAMKNGHLTLEIQAQPGQVCTIEILDRERTQQNTSGLGAMHNAGVLLRRGLSEFRDSTLARNEGLLRVANAIAKALKVTGRD